MVGREDREREGEREGRGSREGIREVRRSRKRGREREEEEGERGMMELLIGENTMKGRNRQKAKVSRYTIR